MIAKILDNGKSNWTETTGESFQLFVDGVYIAALTFSGDTLVLVSTLHSVELKGDV